MREKDAICASCTFKNTPFIKEVAMAPGSIDIVVVGSAPTEADIVGKAFSAKSSQMVRRCFENESAKIRREAGASPFSSWKVAYTYVVHCQVPKVTAELIQHCLPHTISYLERVKPKVILLMGNDALRVLGMHESVTKFRGSVLSYTYEDGTKAVVIPTYHPVTVFKSPGFTSIMVKDIQKAIAYAQDKVNVFDYELKPMTEYQEVIDELGRTLEALDTAEKPRFVSIDTETTSVTPYVKEDRMIAVSLSLWEEDIKAISFPIEHREAAYSQEQVTELIRFIEKILTHKNVKGVVLHNAKFDYQWLALKYGINFKFAADTMLLEHILEEDKKGSYSLKQVTKDRIPWLGGYEDELKALLEEAADKLAEKHKEELKAKGEEVSAAVLEWWKTLDVQQRTQLSATWVERGVASIKQVAGLDTLTLRKYKGEMVIPKKYTNALYAISKNLLATDQMLNLPACREYAELKNKKLEVTFEDIPMASMLKYAAMDALVTRLILSEQREDIKRDYDLICRLGLMESNYKVVLKEAHNRTQPLLSGHSNISIPLSYTLAEMEYYGIRIDRDKLHSYIDIITEKKAELLDAMYSEVGYEFNTSSSSPELVEVIFDRNGWECDKFTESGSRSTDADTLQGLANTYDSQFIRNLLTYRKLEKCLSTYLVNWDALSTVDGKIHCSYNLIGTATFRLSSSRPNLQNVPFQLKEAGLNLKSLFIPDSDEYEFYDLDISNAEMRILCGYARDEGLISAFRDGKDLHCLTAAGISAYTYEDIMANKEDKTSPHYTQRQIAKKVNFGTIYCIGAKGLANQLNADMNLGITEEQAQDYLNKFFVTYPKVEEYVTSTKAFVDRYLFTYTITGRRRRFPIVQLSWAMKNRVSRQAVNARIQSTSADFVGLNIIDLHQELKRLGGRILVTVHDSIGFQIPKGVSGVKSLLDATISKVETKYDNWLPVKWKYDVAKGPSYGEAKDDVV